jgi:hypothetical protein
MQQQSSDGAAGPLNRENSVTRRESPTARATRITMLAEKLMQNDTEAVVRAVVEAAKGGDMTAARLILDRIVPGFNGVCRFDAGGSERLCKRDRSEAESSRNARAWEPHRRFGERGRRKTEKMTSSLERRIERLESNTHVGVDVEKARAIFNAYVRVTDHPARASDEDHALLAHEDWQHAFAILIDAAGGLGALDIHSGSDWHGTYLSPSISRMYRPACWSAPAWPAPSW